MVPDPRHAAPPKPGALNLDRYIQPTVQLDGTFESEIARHEAAGNTTKAAGLRLKQALITIANENRSSRNKTLLTTDLARELENYYATEHGINVQFPEWVIFTGNLMDEMTPWHYRRILVTVAEWQLFVKMEV